MNSNKKIIVIAGNIEQFEFHKTRDYPKDEQERLVYATRYSIMGIEAERVDYVGTYYKREDFRELEWEAESRVR